MKPHYHYCLAANLMDTPGNIYLVEINIQYIGKYINIFEQQLRKVSLRMDVYFLVHEKVTYIIAWFTN